MPEKADAFHERLERIEVLIRQIQAASDPAVQSSAGELVELLLELHRAGLERVLDLVWEEGELGRRVIQEKLPEDDLTSSLLILHGLHPLSLESRVLQALAKVRPYMHSHGGEVELLGIEDGIVRLRLHGSCKTCQASTLTLKYAVEDAIYEAAPEIVAIEAEGLQDEKQGPPRPAFIPFEEVGVNGEEGFGGRVGEWESGGGLDSMGSVDSMKHEPPST